MSNSKDNWTSEEVCQYLGISIRTLSRLIKSGRLSPEAPLGRCEYFDPTKVKLYEIVKEFPPGTRVFRAEVVDKYFATHQKYRVVRKPQGIYWLKIRPDWLRRHPSESLPGRNDRTQSPRIKFRIIRFYEDKYYYDRLVLIEPQYFARLPEADQQEWLKLKF